MSDNETIEKEYRSSVENGKNGGRPAKTTADGDIREDSLAKHDRSAITRNETGAHDAIEPSANHYGVAPHREAGDVSATDSKNMRRVPQNEAPAHGFSGGRTAQGTMPRSPEAAAQSGKAYDQETDQVSTNSHRQTEDRQSRRTWAPVRGSKSSTAHVRSSRPTLAREKTAGRNA